MRTFRAVGVVVVAVAALGVSAWAEAAEVGLQQDPEVTYAPWRTGGAVVTAQAGDRRVQGEVTDIHIVGCDWGTCEGSLTLWRGGMIQTVLVTPATRITSGGQAVSLGKLRPGEPVTVTGYGTAPVPGPEDWTVVHP